MSLKGPSKSVVSFFLKKNRQPQQHQRLIHSSSLLLRPLVISQPSTSPAPLQPTPPSLSWQRSSFFSTTTTNHDKNTSNTSTTTKRITADPTAKRPNAICDPYGQGGKPLSWEEALQMLATTGLQQQHQQAIGDGHGHDDVDDWKHGWHLVNAKGDVLLLDQNHHPITTTPPFALVRTFHHVDYLHAARFLSMLCAVAHNQNHYPQLQLERLLQTKQWLVTTTVTCHTTVLQGLSYNDFHIAMMIDVELQRPEVQKLLLLPS